MSPLPWHLSIPPNSPAVEIRAADDTLVCRLEGPRAGADAAWIVKVAQAMKEAAEAVQRPLAGMGKAVV